MQHTKLALRYVAERVRRGEISEETAVSVRAKLAAFITAMPDDVASIRRRHIERWLEESTVSQGTMRNRLSAARGFCRWCVLNGKMPADPTLGVPAPKSPQRLPRNLHAHESPLVARAPTDRRGRLMVLLMLQELLRCVEVSRLQVGDVDWIRRVIDVRGKGGGGHVTRRIALSAESAAALEAYLEEHPAGAGPLIRSYTNPTAGLTARYISVLGSQWMRDAGVKRAPFDGRSAHACRHTGATDMVENGADIFDVQRALGHADLTSTTVYTNGVTANLRAAMGGRSYLNPTIERRTA